MAVTGIGTAGKGAVATKSGLLGISLASLAPFIAVFAGFLSQLFLIRATTTGRERRNKSLQTMAFFLCVPGLAVGGEFAVEAAAAHWVWSDSIRYVARTVFWWLYALGLATWLVGQLRKAQVLYGRMDQTGAAPAGTMNLSSFSHAMVIAGLHLTMFTWLIAVAYRAHDPVTAALITGMMVAMGVANFISVRRRSGSAVARTVVSHLTLYGIIVLMVLNLRLDVWMATARGVSLAEIHALFSPWIIPSLTLGLVAWIALVWKVTHPRPQAGE
jgi:hypothetical protein